MSDPRTNVARRLRLFERLERLWADDRFTEQPYGAEIRQLAEALMWAAWEGITDQEQYGAYLLGRTGHRDMRSLLYGPVREDAPRYEPPDQRYATPCKAPMKRGPRAGQECGQHPSESVMLTDPTTGQWAMLGYCRAHGAHAEAARVAERIRQRGGSLPKPAPNVGGLLPCYSRRDDWPDLYRSARASWTPPAVGIRRDDWPVLAQVEAAKPPKLVLLHGGGQPAPEGGALPVLRSGLNGHLDTPDVLGPRRSGERPGFELTVVRDHDEEDDHDDDNP